MNEFYLFMKNHFVNGYTGHPSLGVWSSGTVTGPIGMNMAGEGEARKLLGGLGMGCEVPECQPLRGGVEINNFREYIGN